MDKIIIPILSLHRSLQALCDALTKIFYPRFGAVSQALCVVALLASPFSGFAQSLIDPSPRVVQGQEAYQEALLAKNLREQPAQDYEFNRAPLREVLRFLASDAGISYISVPEVGDVEERLITFSIHASPFRALEVITKANGVALFYEDGIWFLRPYDDNELIARVYKLKYNTQEEVKSDSAAATAPRAQTGGIGGTATTGSVPDLGMSLQGVTNVFKTDPKKLIDDIRALLGIPTSGSTATLAGETSVDRQSALPTQIPSPSGAGNAPSSQNIVAGESGGPQVIWNSDSNTLYVIATRQQQQWVEGYLQSMDRPQPLIAIEVKFLETNKNPKEQLGIDWSGTMAEGLTVSARNITASPNGSINVTTDKTHDSLTGTPQPGQSTYDYNTKTKNAVVTFGAPYSAVLSASDLALTLRAFLNDTDSSQVSYPRVLTRNNREVVIRSVINQPVLASSSSVTPGIGGTTTASISYLPIGTIINVLPKEMNDGSISMNISISISDILRQENVGGNFYPVASTRVFNAALSVTSGYTIAIGGLQQAKDDTNKNGVPFLKDIPLLGYAFKSTSRSQEKKNLILFITPTLLPPSGTRGIAEQPISTIPVTPHQTARPAFRPDGTLVGGIKALPDALAWLERQRDYYRQRIKEARFNRKDSDAIQELRRMCDMLTLQIEMLRSESNAGISEESLSAYEQQVTQLNRDFASLRKRGAESKIRI